MNKKLVTLLIIALAAITFGATNIIAGTKFPEKTTFDTPGIKGDKYEKAEFNHVAHSDKYGYTCGDCHHDDKGKALKDLKVGDDVQKCIECHSNLSLDKKEKKKKDNYYRAMHSGKESCKGCHKKFNKPIKAAAKKAKKKAEGLAPTACKGCHIKSKK